MSRRKSRITAFQGLYSWDVGGMDEKDVLELSWLAKDDNSPGLDDEGAAFSRMLIAGTIEHCNEIDGHIKAHLTNWDFERVNKVTIAILRMSVYSLLFHQETEASIVIDEAIDIAKHYGPDDSYKFVNAILDNINKDLKK
ncbi:MAG: transcription antitermination factor NusB [Treponema sp.]|nr:transcription antitermination factor NusB [Candidatus Treponema equifaecale]